MMKYVEVLEGKENSRITDAYIEFRTFAYADICKMCIFAGISFPSAKKTIEWHLPDVYFLLRLDCLIMGWLLVAVKYKCTTFVFAGRAPASKCL
jgi:hypothetical protein